LILKIFSKILKTWTLVDPSSLRKINTILEAFLESRVGCSAIVYEFRGRPENEAVAAAIPFSETGEIRK
jgi:hypothetical protein